VEKVAEVMKAYFRHQTFWKNYGNTVVRKGQIFGRINGFCITKMRLPSQYFSGKRFLAKI